MRSAGRDDEEELVEEEELLDLGCDMAEEAFVVAASPSERDADLDAVDGERELRARRQGSGRKRRSGALRGRRRGGCRGRK